jgi:hypothetical protein
MHLILAALQLILGYPLPLFLTYNTGVLIFFGGVKIMYQTVRITW